MCVRFASAISSEQLAACFQAIGEQEVGPSWNVRPGQTAVAIRRPANAPARQLDVLCWGLMPGHIRSGRHRHRLTAIPADRVTASRMTKSVFTSQRCLVPATSYYEMADRPHAIDCADRMVMAMAAIWDRWQNPSTGVFQEGFAIITRRPADSAAPLVPLVIKQQDWPLWLGEETGSARLLLHAAANEAWRRWPVSRRILNTDDNDPALLTPFPAAQGNSSTLLAEGCQGPRSRTCC